MITLVTVAVTRDSDSSLPFWLFIPLVILVVGGIILSRRKK
jgi:LPXTG-motif cell wall-anchored protein